MGAKTTDKTIRRGGETTAFQSRAASYRLPRIPDRSVDGMRTALPGVSQQQTRSSSSCDGWLAGWLAAALIPRILPFFVELPVDDTPFVASRYGAINPPLPAANVRRAIQGVRLRVRWGAGGEGAPLQAAGPSAWEGHGLLRRDSVRAGREPLQQGRLQR